MVTGQDSNTTGSAQAQTQQAQAAATGTGFSLLSGLMANGQGSELTNNAAKILKDLVAKYELEKKGIKIIACDKEIVNNAYSSIIIGKTTTINKEDAFIYYALVLEATGRKTPTVDDVRNEIQQATITGKVPEIHWADNAVDQVFFTNVEKVLTAELGAIKKYHLDGTVIPANSSMSLEAILTSLLGYAHDTLLINELQAQTGNEINVKAAASRPGVQFHVEVSTPATRNVSNRVGKPVAADIILTLVEKETKNEKTLTSLNQAGGSRVIGSVACKIEWIPARTKIAASANGAFMTHQIEATRIKPHIIITNLNANEPSLGTAMLLIRTAAVLVDPEMWKGIAVDSLTYPAMNILANTENNEKGYGANLSKDFTKLSREEKILMVNKMSEGVDASISIDVEKFGPTTSMLSVFAAAADVNTRNGAKARKEIFETVQKMTSNAFVASAATYPIFTSYSELPLGTFASNQGEDDLRKIDPAFIAALPNSSPEKIYNFMASTLPEAVTGKQPLVSTIKAIADETSSAEVYGRYFRLTFQANFINDVAGAIAADGLSLIYDKLIKTPAQFKFTDLSMFTNSSISGLAGQTAFVNNNGGVDPRLNSFMGYR